MKIRTDFVTNSSSSSFSIILSIKTKDGNAVIFSEDASKNNSDEGEKVKFKAVLSQLWDNKTGQVKGEYEAISDLAKFLLDSIDSNISKKRINQKKELFYDDLTENINQISEISKITVHRDYLGYGEEADFIADNDSVLKSYAQEVMTSEGQQRETALREMSSYIHSAKMKESVGSIAFACGYDDIRYKWHGNDDDLLALSERLYNRYGSYQSKGYEYQEIDLSTGAFSRYAVFDLDNY